MRIDETLKQRARAMRANPTLAERILWLALRADRFHNCQFTRQTVITPYIVDFAARAQKLIIEVDGDTHDSEDCYDAKRTSFLQSLGYRVIRVSNLEVTGNLDGVLSLIAEALADSPSPQPSPQGGRAHI